MPVPSRLTGLVALGERGLRFDLPAGIDRAATLSRLRALPGARDVVLAEAHAAVYFEGEPPDGLDAALVFAAPGAVAREVAVRVVYDGPDLARVASFAGLSTDEVVRRHAAPLYEVRYLGFLPGFAYLAEVSAEIAAPRLPAPRPRVPAGSVGIAGARTGVYPFASPGGWNLVGRVVDFVPFDPEHGAALAPGDHVRFVPA